MSYFPLNTRMNTLPVQMLPMREKDKEWKMACMDALESIGRKQFLDNVNMLENYRMVSNELLYSHYAYSESSTDLAQAATKEFELPPYLRNYDIIGKVIKLLSGEYQTRPDIFRVAAVDEFSTNEYLREKGDMLISSVVGSIMEGIKMKLKAKGLDPDREDFTSDEEKQQYQQQVKQEEEQLTPEAVERYMIEKYRSVPEKWGELIIKLDKQRFNTPELEMVEFEDMLISDRAYRHFYLKANGLGYAQETWNPIRTFFHKSPDIKYVEDGDYVGRVFYLSITEIINRYGHKMRKKDLEDLYGDYLRKNKVGGAEYSFFQATNVPFENYPEYARTVQAFGFDPHTGIPYTGSLGQITNQDVDVLFNSSSTSYNLAGLTLVTEAYWRSQKKVGFLIMQDPKTKEIIEEIVDESYIIPDFIEVVEDEPTYEDFVFYPEKKINTLRWTWVNEAWGGIKINVSSSDKDTRALYIDVKALPFQFKGDTNPYEVKLPVCGAIFNNRNSKSMSLVDLGKPYQILHNVFMNKIFELASTDMGKILVLDPRAIPNDRDWGGARNLQKWITATKESRVGQVDTSPQARVGNNGQPPITVVDGSVFDQIKLSVEIANLIEQQFLYQVGITQQRLGQETSQMTATGVVASLKGSNATTESWFTRFSNYKKRVMQMNLDIAQYCAVTNRDMTISMIQDDMSRQFMQINGIDLLTSQLGVRVFNSQELLRQTEMLKQLVTTNNTSETPMSALAEVIYTESPARIIEVLKNAEAQLAKRAKEERESKERLQKQELEAKQAAIDKQNAWQSQENELDRESRIREKVISVTNFDQDVQDNGQIDVLGIGALELDKQRLAHDKVVSSRDAMSKVIDSANKASIEKKKLDQQKEMQDKEAALKNIEMQNRLQVEAKKQKQIEVQNASQEKIAAAKHKADLELKNKDLQLKDKDIELKKIGLNATKKTAGHEVAGSKNSLDTDKALNAEKLKQTKAVNKLKLATQRKLEAEKVKKAKKPDPKQSK